MTKMADERGLTKNPANFVALSPLSFLKRTRDVYGDYEAIIYGTRRYSWHEVHQRSARLASALIKQGVRPGDVVSLIAANTPELFEAHFGVPMAGAVLNAINTRLDKDTIAYILKHAESRVLITDSQFSPAVAQALAQLKRDDLVVIDIMDAQAPPVEGAGEMLGCMDYEALLNSGDPGFDWQLPTDEWQALSLNYTSGTSGEPKGVVYHHRGAYLMSLGTIAGWGLSGHPRYLYTVPMFHCNGWGHAWTMAALAGTVICCRTITAKNIFALIAKHKVSHFGGAPVVLGLLVNAPEQDRQPITHKVQVMTAGAPPPSTVLEKMQALGIEVMQVYGLTETYGHVIHCAWHEKWDDKPFAEQAEIKARQGVRFPILEAAQVVDVETRKPVPADGQTIGEIVLRGNTVMKGYYKAPEMTAVAFKDGWFHSGDLAVVHENGYIEVKDRLKDVIISGGENISSVEVENVLYKHDAVVAAAIVAMPHEKWGETPCAFVELKAGSKVSEDEIIGFCREHIAGFKTPKKVIFGELPKTATGKIKKFLLREQARYF